MDIIGFVRRHVIASLVLVIGALITVGGWVLDILDLAALGLPNQTWNILGALIFFGAVIVLLAQYDQRAAVKVQKGSKRAAPARDWRSFSFEEPDYKPWMHVDEFTVAQVAHLWAKEDPNTPIQSSEFLGYRTALLQAIEQQRLKPVKQYRFGNAEDWTISRGELKRYMEELGERPRFLFFQKSGRI